MIVYVVCHIPDYIGVDIDGIYLDEADAKIACEKLNADDYVYKTTHEEQYFYDSYEVIEHAK